MDEIQAGYGRTGKFWGHEHFNVQPDVVLTAKGLASGFPLSAFGANEELMAQGWGGSQGGTYGGNAVSCAAALATLDVIEEEGLMQNAAEQGEYLLSRLKELQSNHPGMGDVRGKGLLMGVEMVNQEGKPDGERAGALLQECERRQLLMLRCGPNKQVVRWLPPLIVKREQIDDALDAFSDALEATA
jgi:acetylornithine aminotransferase/4-aminobutyrate aminotransferase